MGRSASLARRIFPSDDNCDALGSSSAKLFHWIAPEIKILNWKKN